MRAWRARLLCINMFIQAISRIGEIFDLGLWSQWFDQLDRTFVFLLVLPFVVAVVGLWSAYRDQEEDKDKEE